MYHGQYGRLLDTGVTHGKMVAVRSGSLMTMSVRCIGDLAHHRRLRRVYGCI